MSDLDKKVNEDKEADASTDTGAESNAEDTNAEVETNFDQDTGQEDGNTIVDYYLNGDMEAMKRSVHDKVVQSVSDYVSNLKADGSEGGNED